MHCPFIRYRPLVVNDRRVFACNSSTTTGHYIDFDGRLHRSVSRNELFNELFVPRLENEQRPNLLISGKPAFLLETNDLFDGLRIEEFPAR